MNDDIQDIKSDENNEGQPATIEHLIALLISSNKLLLDVYLD